MARLDFHGDVTLRQLRKIAATYDLPAFVREASEEVLQLPPRRGQYADAIGKQFACHNKVATLLSIGYFLENSGSLPEKQRARVGDELRKFAAYWGIMPEFETMVQKKASLVKEANATTLPDSSYALVKQSSDGVVTREFPLRNALEVKTAAEWFVSNLDALREQYPFQDRCQIATRILDKAADYGAAIDAFEDTLEQCAGCGMTAPLTIAGELDKRAQLLRANHAPAEVADGVTKLASLIRNKPYVFMETSELHQLAETIEQVDRTSGLLNKYSSTIPSPESIVFGVTRRQMRDIRDNSFETSAGSVYMRPQLEKVSLDLLRTVFGDQITDTVREGLSLSVEKLADVASTLNPTDAELFDDLMSSVGETPVKRAAFRTGIDPSVLVSLAQS